MTLGLVGDRLRARKSPALREQPGHDRKVSSDMKTLPESTPLEQAKATLDEAVDQFNRVANSTTPPGKLQQAVNDLMYAVNHYADLKRETVRGAA